MEEKKMKKLATVINLVVYVMAFILLICNHKGIVFRVSLAMFVSLTVYYLWKFVTWITK